MPESGLLVTQLDEITTVTFRNTSILDLSVVQTIGGELYRLVDAQAKRKILLNFGPVRFLSSQMLAVLLNLHQKASAIGGRVAVCNLRPELQKVFEVMNLHKVLHFADSESEAIGMLNETPRA